MDEIHSQLKSIGEKFPIDQAVDALRDENCYEGWQDELRYLLFRYEEYLAAKEGLNFKNEQWERIWMASASRSIEHIYAQSSAPDDIRHNLGNLMILPPGLNSKLQDKSFSKKRPAYQQTGLLMAGEVASVTRWTRRAVKKRETELLEWAAEEWAD